MNIIFKFIFERITDPLGLPINASYEYIILGIIGLLAYGVSFIKVGDFYHNGLIRGKTAGSLYHWLLRGSLFVLLWFAVYCIVQAYFWIVLNWQKLLLIGGSIVGLFTLGIIGVFTVRFIINRKGKTSSC